jgi:hypothetical protein
MKKSYKPVHVAYYFKENRMPFIFLNYENCKPLKNADYSIKKKCILLKIYFKTESLKAVSFASQVD